MKATDFIQAMDGIEEKYIDEAIGYKASGNISLRHMKLWRGIAIAACALLAASAALAIISMNVGSGNYRRDSSPNYYYSVEELDEGTAATGTNTGNFYAAQDTASFKAMGAYDEAEALEYAYEEAVEDDYDMAAPVYRSAAEPQTAASMENGLVVTAETAAAIANDITASAADITADAADGMPAGEAGAEAGGDAEDARDEEDLLPKKIIYNVYMNMQTKEFDTAVRGIEQTVEQFGGYCENQYISNASSGYRSANYTVRVPAQRLDEFLERAGDVCAVTYMSRSAQDVSDSYYDSQSRLESARTKLGRLQELMQEAQDMEDLIAIESAITDVEWEIDNYGSTLKYYDSQVQYSTVTINLDEVYEVMVEEAPLTFGERISNSFRQGLRGLGVFCRNLVIWLAASWIWLAVLAVVIVVVILIIRKHHRRKQ